ncbi:hypothetical protein [Streptomyces sp. Amel2xB2]|uniref:hypothetical protein n=1 Tax=Streptomyces sp. Amel2xB2 TaxID=1305829 RepID=UPI0021AC3258|nr:hypothetical protein [Streptomyces sp. Amel2xB2]
MTVNKDKQLQILVLLMAGAGAAYVTAYHPAAGTPLLVGVGVIGALRMLMDHDEQ